MITIEVQGVGRIEAEHGMCVGRDGGWADLCLSHEGISRHHLEIRTTSEGYRVWDLGSFNGTSVGGVAVGLRGRALAAGDVIDVGGVVDLRVVEMSPPPLVTETVPAPGRWMLDVRLDGDRFVVTRQMGAERLRDSMPYQLGLSLSLLALFTRDGLGPVPDVDLRALVWRGDARGREAGDINRLLLRLRTWFRDRGVAPPLIRRVKGAATTELDAEGGVVQVHPDTWLYRFLDDTLA